MTSRRSSGEIRNTGMNKSYSLFYSYHKLPLWSRSWDRVWNYNSRRWRLIDRDILPSYVLKVFGQVRVLCSCSRLALLSGGRMESGIQKPYNILHTLTWKETPWDLEKLLLPSRHRLGCCLAWSVIATLPQQVTVWDHLETNKNKEPTMSLTESSWKV